MQKWGGPRSGGSMCVLGAWERSAAHHPLTSHEPALHPQAFNTSMYYRLALRTFPQLLSLEVANTTYRPWPGLARRYLELQVCNIRMH